MLCDDLKLWIHTYEDDYSSKVSVVIVSIQ